MSSVITFPLAMSGMLRRLAGVSSGYLALWCALLVMSVALVVLMRSRWGQGRPLQKCAVLSLLVHLVFACLAMTVRVVVGDGSGHGSGPPIRVRIVDDTSEALLAEVSALPVEPALLPPELYQPPPQPPAPDKTPLTSADEPSEPSQPPPAPVLAEAAPAAAPGHASPDELPTDGHSPTVDEPPASKNPAPGPAVELPLAAGANHAMQRTNAPAPAAVARVPDAYKLRTASSRLGMIESQGGNARTEAAVQAGLTWLAVAQSADGHWDADRFGAGHEMKVLGHDRHGAGRNADTGITALALLAFLGAGHSHQQGEFQPIVRRGLDFLRRSQASDGSIFGNAEFFARMYCHSMSAFALAEAQAMTGDVALEPTVTRAIAYCVRAQNSTTGGWRYQPGDAGDTSQLGWQMMALASAERAGVAVPQETWSAIERYLDSVRRGKEGGLASYRPDSHATTSMTAEALYCRLLLGEPLGATIHDRPAAEATIELLAHIPDPNRINLYYWYYATLALHHRQQANDEAATAWRAWNDALVTTLLDTQVDSGPNAGCWNADCLWGGYGGRVYTTAMATMCLEVYYRYPPAQPRMPWVATRGATDSR
jgi:hypothetical protein